MSRKMHACACGGEPSLMKFGQSWIVECTQCSFNSGAFSTPEMAMATWNKKVAATSQIVEVRVKRLRDNAQLPMRAHPGDVGLDLFASVVNVDHGIVRIGSGIAVELAGMPVHGYQLRPRSSIYKTGLIMPNSPGTVEATYRGELAVNFVMLGKPPIEEAQDIYKIGDRFCQLVFPETIDPRKIVVIEVDRLSDTERGEDGFGSTGR